MALLKLQISYVEFLEWVEFLRMEERRHSKEEHYLAQIAAEIRRSVVASKSAKKIRLADFLLEFRSPEQVDQLKKSKSAWGMAVGIDLSKN